MYHLKGLNEAQQAAVETVEGPILVLAGAGSGKTRVVTYRIANLLELGIPSSKILGVTFTNKAAGEMQERVRTLTQSNVLISTFHSLGARILRESIHVLGYKSQFSIYDEDDTYKLLKACIDDLAITDKKMEPKAFKQLISQAKNNLQGPEDCEKGPSPLEELFPSVYARYQTYLQEYHALDFDDLLYLTVKLLRDHPEVLENYQNRWAFLLIDEYQDTNQAQYEMVRLLVARSGNICVVGDPDQSIYSWRGANIKNILNFEMDFPGAKVVRLEQNYRSRSNILEAANALIGFNFNRYEKNLWSDLGPGEKIKHFTGDTEQDEARFVADRIAYYHDKHKIPLKEMVVFYRTNSQSRVFEDRFLFKRIPYVIIGGISFYQRREIKDILAFLKMVHSSSDFISFSRTINIPKRGIGEASIEKIRIGATQEGLSIIDFCEKLVRGESLMFPIKLTPKQRQGLTEYLNIINELKRISKDCSLKEVVISAIEQSGYLKILAEDRETFDDRKGNLDELITKSIEWELATESPSLGAFLEELSLKSTLDETSSEQDRVNFMTIHNGKGLEFPVVFIVGMEEDLFPHANSRDSKEAIEEERRLCYVGMTRAKEYLYLADARTRYLWGTSRTQRPSRFLKEIPSKYVEKLRSGISAAYPRRSRQNEEFIEEIDQTKGAVGFDEIVLGDAVFHNEFGVGIVQEMSQGSLGLTYKIHFSKGNDTKSIVAKYANLKKL
jgi:DNA helicase-2/ATP-dependent DNA helicase PcrA